IGEYVDLPKAYLKRIDFWGWTKFSNMLRLLLLEKHGGTWIDATVLLAGPLPSFITERDFFVFRWNDARILANWFIHAGEGHPLISACRLAYERYWTTVPEPGPYFMFHFIFEALIVASRDLQAPWDKLPFHDAAIPHEMQEMLDRPFSADQWRQITGRSSIQK